MNESYLRRLLLRAMPPGRPASGAARAGRRKYRCAPARRACGGRAKAEIRKCSTWRADARGRLLRAENSRLDRQAQSRSLARLPVVARARFQPAADEER